KTGRRVLVGGAGWSRSRIRQPTMLCCCRVPRRYTSQNRSDSKAARGASCPGCRMQENEKERLGPMSRAIILERLQRARDHVESGDRHISAQREIIQKRKVLGLDTVHAEKMPIDFEKMQTLHIAHRDQLEAELAASAE